MNLYLNNKGTFIALLIFPLWYVRESPSEPADQGCDGDEEQQTDPEDSACDTEGGTPLTQPEQHIQQNQREAQVSGGTSWRDNQKGNLCFSCARCLLL